MNVIKNTAVQITYPCLLTSFGTGFESTHDLFLFGITLGGPVPFRASRVGNDFSVLSLWFSMGVGKITVRIYFFGCKQLFCLSMPPLPPSVLPRLVVAECHH